MLPCFFLSSSSLSPLCPNPEASRSIFVVIVRLASKLWPIALRAAATVLLLGITAVHRTRR